MTMKYDTSFAQRVGINDRAHWRRFGLSWTDAEYKALSKYFVQHDFERICVLMHRPPAGVLAKLYYCGLIKPTTSYSTYVYTEKGRKLLAASGQITDSNPDDLAVVSTTESEVIMNPDKVESRAPVTETKFLINGRDAAEMTDLQVIGEVKKLEDQVEKLKSVKHKSNKVDKLIASAEQHITTIIEYLDAREEK